MKLSAFTLNWRNILLFALWFAQAAGLFLAANWEADRQEGARLDAFHSDLANLSQVSGAIMASRLRGYDDALLTLREFYSADPAHFHQHVQWLRRGPLADRELLVVVLDREGILAYTDTPDAKPRLDLHDAKYFRYFADGGKDRYLIDEPLFGRVTRRYSVPLARPIYDGQGNFRGVVALSVRQDALADFGPNLHLSRDTAVTVVTQRGAVVTRSRDLAKVQGTRVAPDLLAQIAQAEEGVLADALTAEGEHRTVAYHHIADTPLILYVSASAANLLRVSTEQRNTLLAGAALAAILSLLLLVAYIKHQKLTAKFIATQQDHLREAQRIAGMGSFGYDPATKRFQWSDEMYRLLGFPGANRAPDLQTFLAQVAESERAAVESVLERGPVGARGRIEFSITRGDGDSRHLLLHSEALGDRNGKLSSVIGTLRDITERKRTAQTLQRQHDTLAAIFENLPGAISVFDADLHLVAHNEQFKRLLGFPDALFDKPVARFEDFIRFNIKRGEYGPGDPEQQVATATARARNFEPHKFERARPDGTALEIRGTPLPGGGFVTIYTDISERKKAEEEIMHLAFSDPLTGLPNRRLLMDRLRQALAASSRSKRQGALLLIDLDNFKTLNDTLGHEKGDLLLQQVAQRLVGCVRDGDTVARLGGDEFVVMLEGLSENAGEAATHTEGVGEKIVAALNQAYLLGGRDHRSTPSIGVTLFAGHQTSIEELLKQADLAMYQAKAAGRNTLRFFDPAMQTVVSARAALEVELREAVLRNQFMLFYQAQVGANGRMTGAEALVRWQHPARGLVMPLEFIFLAEDTGLILPLGHWVLETACTQLAAWTAHPELAHLCVAVNVSAHQFHHKEFVAQVLDVLDRTGANPQRLKLELTESLLLADVEDVIAKMSALKVRGVGFSLDDFGTGYSSLAHLKRLPLDQLKIDQGFIKNILSDPNDAAIAKMVVALAASMGIAVIAEGVELEAQREFLASQNCHAYQGYLFSHPLPLAAFEELVRRA